MIADRISPRRWLHLPIETKAREFDAKMLLACMAAERGWGAIIGGKSVLRRFQKHLPRGVFLEKNIGPRQTAQFASNKAHGNRVAPWCEEGLTYFSKPDFFRLKFDERAFVLADYAFVWGQWQKNAIVAQRGKDDRKIIACGNPRLDMLRPEMRPFYAASVDELRRIHNRIILINTNFSGCNLNSNESFKELLKRTGKLRDKATEVFAGNYVAFQERMFGYFKDALPALAEAFPQHTIVIRPHPSEGHPAWDAIAKPHANVKVIFEGSAIDWILASEILIQNNCTTGAEAFVLKAPCISYRPFRDSDFDDELINGLGHTATNLPDLVEMTRAIVEGTDPSTPEQRAEWDKLASLHMSALDGRPASERILDHLEQLELPIQPGRTLAGALSMQARAVSRNLLGLFGGAGNREYVKQKFAGITAGEMNDILMRFGQATGRFEGLSVQSVAPDLFCVYRK